MDILKVLSAAEEFSDHSARRNEKKELKELGAQCRFPIARIVDRADKVSCLLQCSLEGVLPTDWALKTETALLRPKASRVIRCMVQFLIEKRWFSPLLHALKLQQAIAAEMWEDSASLLRQIPGVGEKMSTMLINAGITTFAKATEVGPRQLEKVVNRNPPFGDSLLDWIRSTPKYEIQAESAGVGKVNVTLRTAEGCRPSQSKFQKKCSVIVGTGSTLLYHGEVRQKATSPNQEVLRASVAIPPKLQGTALQIQVCHHDVGTFYFY